MALLNPTPKGVGNSLSPSEQIRFPFPPFRGLGGFLFSGLGGLSSSSFGWRITKDNDWNNELRAQPSTFWQRPILLVLKQH